MCLYPLKGYQMDKNYISTSAMRNACGAGGGRLGDNRSTTCVCFAHLLFPSGLVTLLDVGYWAGQALHLICYSCSHVCKLWDFKHFKNPERSGLLPKYHVGFVFIFKKKKIKSKMSTRSNRNSAGKQLLECIRFKGLLVKHYTQLNVILDIF